MLINPGNISILESLIESPDIVNKAITSGELQNCLQ